MPSSSKERPPRKAQDLLFHQKIFLTLTRRGAKWKELDSGALLFTCEFYNEVSWTPDLSFFPLDVQYIPICIEIAPLEIGTNRYYFNIMNKHKHRKEFFMPRLHIHRLEDFLFYYCQTRYEPVRADIGRRRIEYSPQITLYFALIRSPWSSFLKILVPSFIFQLLGLILFFTQNDFDQRVENILVLILGIVAFLPTVRAGLPNTPDMTLIDWIIFSSVVNVGLCMIATSINKDDLESDEHTVWFILACTQVFLTSMLAASYIFLRRILMWIKTRERKYALEKRIKEEMSLKSTLEVYEVSYDELEKTGGGSQAVVPTMSVLPGFSAESRQSLEFGQNGMVESSSGDSLTFMEKRYVTREVELRARTTERLKTINEIP